MGTFRDISLFGNFLFPLEGDYAGGIIARSLAGVGKEVKKTKTQLQKISLRNAPMAGSTGSSISSELPPAREGELWGHPTAEETYSIRFINHAPDPLQTPSFIENGRTESSIQPSSEFALKNYLRGLHPSACTSASTVPVPPTPTQASGFAVPVQQSTPAQAPGPTVSVQQSTPAQAPGSTVPVQQSTPAQAPGSTVLVQQSTPAQAPGPTVSVTQAPGSTVPVQPSATLTGHGVSGLADILAVDIPC